MITLWEKGCAYPSPDSRILALPFTFQLPAGLPPSYSREGSGYAAKIVYELHVLGERPGIFRSNRSIHMLLPVLSAHEEGARLHSMIITSGWQGNWKKQERKIEIRRQIWGPYSEVYATVRMNLEVIKPKGWHRTHHWLSFRCQISTTFLLTRLYLSNSILLLTHSR